MKDLKVKNEGKINVYITLTDQCFQNCYFCHNKNKFKENEIPFETVNHIFNLFDNNNYCLALYGGNPEHYSNLEKIINLKRDNVSFMSSLDKEIHIPDNWLPYLSDHGCNLGKSVLHKSFVINLSKSFFNRDKLALDIVATPEFLSKKEKYINTLLKLNPATLNILKLRDVGDQKINEQNYQTLIKYVNDNVSSNCPIIVTDCDNSKKAIYIDNCGYLLDIKTHTQILNVLNYSSSDEIIRDYHKFLENKGIVNENNI
jgi:organic radical activating enzyme